MCPFFYVAIYQNIVYTYFRTKKKRNDGMNKIIKNNLGGGAQS